MDLISFILYLYLSALFGPYAPLWLFFAVHGAVWATLVIPVGGLVVELASRHRLGPPRFWAVAVALAPSVILPFFLFCLRRHGDRSARYPAGRRLRRRGYAAAAAALLVVGVLQFLFFQTLAQSDRSHRISPPTVQSF